MSRDLPSAAAKRAYNLREKATYHAYREANGPVRGGQKGFRRLMRSRPIAARPLSLLGPHQRAKRETALRVLGRSRRFNEPLSKAARENHTSPETVRRYLGRSGYRKVGGHELLRSCGAAEALSVVERAVLARFPKTGRAPGLTLKTDGGAQFVAHRFQEGCRTIGISLMATRKRRPEDNGMMESWNGHFKQDYLWIREPVTFLETRQVVDEGVVDYNTQRPHSSLEYLTPSEYAERKKEEQRAGTERPTTRGRTPLPEPHPQVYKREGSTSGVGGRPPSPFRSEEPMLRSGIRPLSSDDTTTRTPGMARP
jgi:transposase InsO family protein